MSPTLNPTREQVKKWNLSSRYRVTLDWLREQTDAQAGLCAICRQKMARICIDHDHTTGAIRELLCHGCNIKLPAVESVLWRTAAITYLARHGGA